MDAITVLKTRRSVRAYAADPVAKDILTDLVDIARLAPSAMNGQQWEFVIITDRAMLKQIAGLITHAPFIADVPAAIAVLCKEHRFYAEDGSAATMALLCGATAHGLGSCWISGDKQPYADAVGRLLGAPAGLKFMSLVTLGKAAQKPAPEKRPLSSVMHWEKL